MAPSVFWAFFGQNTEGVSLRRVNVVEVLNLDEVRHSFNLLSKWLLIIDKWLFISCER